MANTPGETKKPREWERFVPDLIDAVIVYSLNIQIDLHLAGCLKLELPRGPSKTIFLNQNHVKHISVFPLCGNSQNTFLFLGISSGQTDPILAK